MILEHDMTIATKMLNRSHLLRLRPFHVPNHYRDSFPDKLPSRLTKTDNITYTTDSETGKNAKGDTKSRIHLANRRYTGYSSVPAVVGCAEQEEEDGGRRKITPPFLRVKGPFPPTDRLDKGGNIRNASSHHRPSTFPKAF